MSISFSANLGFLWTDRPLPDAIHAAKSAGFAAVECHWPYDTPLAEVKAALEETAMPMLGLNTSRGVPARGDFGLSSIPGREDEARAAIQEAVHYAQGIGAGMIHVMAGNAQGAAAREVFVDALRYALDLAGEDITILIEPLNRHDAPDYFLRDTGQAIEIIEEIGANTLKLMFDCYHVQRTEGDVCTRMTALLPHIGHVQIASSPDRGAPDQGELDYSFVLGHLKALGWSKPIGAEYKPAGDTDQSLSWLPKFRDL